MGPYRFARACEDLQFVLHRQPDNAEAQMLLARVYLARGQNAKAADVLVGLRRQRPADFAVSMLYSLALSRAGQPGPAVDLLQPFTPELEKDDSLWVMAILLGDAGRHEQAIALLRGRIERAASPAMALADKGILVHVLGRAKQLPAALELADSMVDPNVPDSAQAAAIARMGVLAEAGRFSDM